VIQKKSEKTHALVENVKHAIIVGGVYDKTKAKKGGNGGKGSLQGQHT